MSLPIIPVIIPAYRKPKQLRLCLEHLESQTQPVAVFVRDNSEDNIYFTAAVNEGIRRFLATDCPAMLILNQSMYLAPDAVEQLWRFMEANPRCGIAAPIEVIAGHPEGLALGGGLETFPWGRHRVSRADDFRYDENLYWANGTCLLLRREMIEEIGLLDCNLKCICSDTDYCFTARERGWQVWRVGSALGKHELSATNNQNFELRRIKMQDALFFAQKWLTGDIYRKLNFNGERLTVDAIQAGLEQLRNVHYSDAKQSALNIREQFEKHKIRALGVIHVGAHVGQELPLYFNMGFQNILLIEPNPSVFQKLQNNANRLIAQCTDSKRPRIFLANCAVAESNGQAIFNINANDESSSLLPLFKHREIFPEMIEVKQINVLKTRLDDLVVSMGLSPFDFNFVNIDVQGAESMVFQGAAATLRNADAICSEISFQELYYGSALANEIDDILAMHSFERVETCSPHRPEWADAFYVRRIKATAIVSTYEGEALIRQRLENLISQSLFQSGGLEVIVIDSASPQNEKNIVNEFVDLHPNFIRYIRTNQRETIYAAWNRAIQLSRGKYVTNQNVDDRMKHYAIERLASYLDDHVNCILVHADQQKVIPGEDVDLESLLEPHWKWPAFVDLLLMFNTQVGSQPMWRASAVLQIGFFDPTFSALGDREFYLRLSRLGTFHFLPEVLGTLDYNVNSLSRTPELAELETKRIWSKYLEVNELAKLLRCDVHQTNHPSNVLRQILVNNYCCILMEQLIEKGLFATPALINFLVYILDTTLSVPDFKETIEFNQKLLQSLIISTSNDFKIAGFMEMLKKIPI